MDDLYRVVARAELLIGGGLGTYGQPYERQISAVLLVKRQHLHCRKVEGILPEPLVE